MATLLDNIYIENTAKYVSLCNTVWRADYEKPMRTAHKEGEMSA
jgi:hypothetical protein